MYWYEHTFYTPHHETPSDSTSELDFGSSMTCRTCK
jgi:hypothetical protein